MDRGRLRVVEGWVLAGCATVRRVAMHPRQMRGEPAWLCPPSTGANSRTVPVKDNLPLVDRERQGGIVKIENPWQKPQVLPDDEDPLPWMGIDFGAGP